MKSARFMLVAGAVMLVAGAVMLVSCVDPTLDGENDVGPSPTTDAGQPSAVDDAAMPSMDAALPSTDAASPGADAGFRDGSTFDANVEQDDASAPLDAGAPDAATLRDAEAWSDAALDAGTALCPTEPGVSANFLAHPFVFTSRGGRAWAREVEFAGDSLVVLFEDEDASPDTTTFEGIVVAEWDGLRWHEVYSRIDYSGPLYPSQNVWGLRATDGRILWYDSLHYDLRTLERNPSGRWELGPRFQLDPNALPIDYRLDGEHTLVSYEASESAPARTVVYGGSGGRLQQVQTLMHGGRLRGSAGTIAVGETLYRWNGSSYVPVSLSLDAPAFGELDTRGSAVARGLCEASRTMCGDAPAVSNAGVVEVWDLDGNVAGPTHHLAAHNAGPGDRFCQVTMGPNSLVVHATLEDGPGLGLDGDPALDTAPDRGAYYLFQPDADGTWRQRGYLKPPTAMEAHAPPALSRDAIALVPVFPFGSTLRSPTVYVYHHTPRADCSDTVPCAFGTCGEDRTCEPCQEALCASGTYCDGDNGRCAPRRSIGELCRAPTQCASGKCNVDTGRCDDVQCTQGPCCNAGALKTSGTPCDVTVTGLAGCELQIDYCSWCEWASWGMCDGKASTCVIAADPDHAGSLCSWAPLGREPDGCASVCN